MTNLSTYKRFFLIMGLLCLAAVILNLAVRRGPVHDATAVEDLHSISSSIDGYFSKNMRLPATLDDIKPNLGAATRQRLGDYEYVPSGGGNYQLCATFAAAGDFGETTMPYPGAGNPDPAQHAKGRQCFDFVVNNFGAGSPKPL